MTARAVLIGFACAFFLCWVCFFNDQVIRQSTMIRCFLPVSVYGGLLFLVILVNPLLRRLSRRLALSAREMAVIVGLTLAVCYVPGYGLMQTLTPFLMLPHHYARTEPGWRDAGVLEAVPKFMLADVGRNENTVLDGFVNGLAEGDAHIPWSRVPWYAWAETLSFWVPVILTLVVLSIALAVVVHRQWSDHEHISYPIATFANSLLPGEDRSWNPLLRNRLFWLGLAVTTLVHLNNYGYQWYPGHMIEVPRRLDFTSLRTFFPTLVAGGGWILFEPRIVFTAIGFAYFLASDVSLSLGVAPFLYCTVVGVLLGFGVAVRGAHLSQGLEGYLYAGAFSGVFLALIYTGRHYYWSVIRRALGLASRDEVRPAAMWAARIGAAAFVLLVAQLASTGLDWQLALLYVCVTIMLLTVLSRVVAETGVFYIYPTFFPCALLAGFIGFGALGFKTVVILFSITTAIMINPSEALMPFVVQANKLIDLNRAKIGRIAAVSVLVIVVGLAAALFRTLYWQYDRGGKVAGHGWAINNVPRYGLNEAVRVKYRLEAQGTLKTAESLSGWRRFGRASPDGPRMLAFGTSLALVLLCAAGRFRFARWPLHPVLFLVLGTWQSRVLAPAFLAGWAIKVGVTRYGGSSGFQKLKPLMIGLIAGEMLTGFVLMVVGAVYYSVTGQPPMTYGVLPI